MRWHNNFHYEEQNFLDVPRTPVCNHYPWWRLGDVAEKRFDIVTANANLNEFSREALFQYLSVIRDVLADEGVIIAQCLGGGPPTYDSVLANMKSVGFVPVALVAGNADDTGRIFVVSNGVFVGKNHPLYAEYADRTPQFTTWDRNIEFIDRMFFINEEHPGKKRIMSAIDVLDTIDERLKAAAHDVQSVPHSSNLPNESSVSLQTGEAGILPAISNAHTPRKMTTSAHRIEINRLRIINAAQPSRNGSGGDSSKELRRLAAEKRAVEQRAVQLSAELEAVKSSASWRATAPLRSLPPVPKRILKGCARFARSFIAPILPTGTR